MPYHLQKRQLCIDVCVDMCIDMCIDTLIGMCIDMRIDIRINIFDVQPAAPCTNPGICAWSYMRAVTAMSIDFLGWTYA